MVEKATLHLQAKVGTYMAVFIGLVVGKFYFLKGHFLPHPELSGVGVIWVIVLHLVSAVCICLAHLYPFRIQVFITVRIHWHHL